MIHDMTPRDPMDELIEIVDRWHPPNPEHAAGWLFKLGEEVGELMGAYVKEQPRDDEAGEAADTLICLVLYCRSRGIDLVAEAIKKMNVNEHRTGKVNRHGVFVKSADLTQKIERERIPHYGCTTGCSADGVICASHRRCEICGATADAGVCQGTQEPIPFVRWVKGETT